MTEPVSSSWFMERPSIPPSSRSKDRGCCRLGKKREKKYTHMPKMGAQEKRQADVQKGKEEEISGTEILVQSLGTMLSLRPGPTRAR